MLIPGVACCVLGGIIEWTLKMSVDVSFIVSYFVFHSLQSCENMPTLLLVIWWSKFPPIFVWFSILSYHRKVWLTLQNINMKGSMGCLEVYWFFVGYRQIFLAWFSNKFNWEKKLQNLGKLHALCNCQHFSDMFSSKSVGTLFSLKFKAKFFVILLTILSSLTMFVFADVFHPWFRRTLHWWSHILKPWQKFV